MGTNRYPNAGSQEVLSQFDMLTVYCRYYKTRRHIVNVQDNDSIFTGPSNV